MNGKPDDHSGPKVGKESARRFLATILEHGNMSKPELAARAGMSPSTLYRIEDDDDPYQTSMTTIRKLEAASGIPFTVAFGGMAEPEARFIDIGMPDTLKPGKNEGVWRLGTRVAELAGFMPGDIILFDLSATPGRGDLVVAQVEDRTGGAETVIRVYDPPFLVTRTTDPTCMLKPLTVDGEAVRIAGVFKRMVRERT